MTSLARLLGDVTVRKSFFLNALITRIVRERLCGATPCGGSRPSDSLMPRSKWLDYAEGASTGFMVASGGVLSEGYGHDGPGVCLGDGQTEAEVVPSQGGRGDALLRRMPPYLTCRRRK